MPSCLQALREVGLDTAAVGQERYCVLFSWRTRVAIMPQDPMRHMGPVSPCPQQIPASNLIPELVTVRWPVRSPTPMRSTRMRKCDAQPDCHFISIEAPNTTMSPHSPIRGQRSSQITRAGLCERDPDSSSAKLKLPRGQHQAKLSPNPNYQPSAIKGRSREASWHVNRRVFSLPPLRSLFGSA